MTDNPSTDDIREWGKQNGYEVGESGRLPRGLRTEYARAHSDIDPLADVSYESVADTPTETFDFDAPMGAPTSVEEKRPQVNTSKTTVKDFFSSKTTKKRSSSRAKNTKPRVSAENSISFGWSLLARMLKPISPPMGRLLAIEAPVAGRLLDQPIKGTVIDKMIQPFARAEDGSKAVAALIVPPLLVGAIDKAPGMAEVFLPALRESLAMYLKVAGPQIKRMKEEREEFEAEYGEILDDLILTIFPDLYESSDESE
jgi:hypothetical protein